MTTREQGKKVHTHQTVPILVWVDVDVGIAEKVIELNKMKGIRTLASCQGTIGEGGAAEYGPHVMVTWESEAILEELKKQYDVEVLGLAYGYLWMGPRPYLPPNPAERL